VANKQSEELEFPVESRGKPIGRNDFEQDGVIMPRSRAQTLAGLALLALLPPAHIYGAEAPLKRVLILHSFGQQVEPFWTVAGAFRTELSLRSRNPIEFYEGSLETARFLEGDIDRPFADYLRALLNQPPDLVVPVGAPAFHFVQRHRGDLFSDVPVLVAGIESRHLSSIELGPRTTAVTFSLDLVGFIKDILHVLPGTNRMSVVIGDSPLDRYWVEEMRQAWQVFNGKIEFTWFSDLTLAGMRERVEAMPPHSAIVFALNDFNASGVPNEPGAALDALTKATSAPIFGFFEPELGHGVVGGRLTDVRGLGIRSADMAMRILNGESPGSIPAYAAPPPVPQFDWAQLRRWRIDTSRLPPGSVIRYREPSLWEEYRWRIMAAGVLVALEAMLILLLMKNRERLHATRLDLLKNQENVRLAAHAARLGFWTLDLDRDQLWITDEGRELFGWDKTESLGFERFLDTLRPEDREPARRAVRRALDGGGDFEAEHAIVLKDGSQRWISTRGSAHRNEAKQPVTLSGVSMDITARKRAVREAQDLRRELSHSARVSLLGQFTASLAHELGQPLGAIRRNADAAELFLKNTPPDLEEIRAILSDMHKDCERAAMVIDRLRTMLRRRGIEIQPLVWSELVHEAVSIVRPDAQARGIFLEIETPLGLPRLMGDRVHVQQVLINLIANAMDAIDEDSGGDRRVTVSAHTENGNLECAISDTGPGIPPHRLQTIFDPFVTTKLNGMGMGLPICQTIVETLGGRLWAENQAGHGAIFRFILPTAES
jgi:PAS domain S-box-containing protein